MHMKRIRNAMLEACHEERIVAVSIHATAIQSSINRLYSSPALVLIHTLRSGVSRKSL